MVGIIKFNFPSLILLIIIQNSNSLQTINLNENYLDSFNDEDGSYEKPFKQMKDVFIYSYSNMLEINVHSNFLCNQSFYNNGSKIFRFVLKNLF